MLEPTWFLMLYWKPNTFWVLLIHNQYQTLDMYQEKVFLVHIKFLESKTFQIEKRKPYIIGLELKLVCKIHKSKSLKTFFSIAQCIAFLEKIFGFVVNTLYACFCNLTAYIKNTSTAFTFIVYRNVSKKNKKSSP